MKLFRILTLGIMFSLIMACGDDKSTVDNTVDNTDETELKLADFTDTSTLPTEDTWIIIDNSGTTDDFRGLKSALRQAERDNREIKLVFPNIVTIPEEAFYTIDEQPITSLVSVSASNATDIGDFAFFYCSALAEVNLPLATDIGDFAFENCSALTKVAIPNATNIGEYAFSFCTSLAEVNLPLATTIGEYAFLYCSSLTEVNLPLATNIGDHAFYDCSALTTMTIATESTLENIDTNAFISDSSSDSPTDTTKITVTTRADANVKKITDLNLDFKKIIGQ